MYNDPNGNLQNAGNMGGQQFVEGTPVYDSVGDKLGTVSSQNVEGAYLVVKKGIFFPHDVYVPLQSIARNDADGIYLNMTKDQALNQDWQNPPQATAGRETYGTTTGATTGAAATAQNVGQNIRQDVGAATTNARTTGQTTNDNVIEAPVVEEELVAGKRAQETGRVRIHKEVIEEPRTINTTVRREQVRVENVPADQMTADANTLNENTFQDRDIEVPVMGEEVVVGKQARVTGEVRVSKTPVEEQRQFSDTVRREHVDVEGVDESGNPVNLGGDAYGNDQPMNPNR